MDERAEAGELGNFTFHEIANLVFLVNGLPRVFGQLFDPKTYPLIHLVDVDNDGLDFVALLKHFAGMIDLAGPAQIGHVNHAVNAFLQFHERAIGGHVANLTFNLAADGKLLLDFIPRIGLELAQAQ